MVLNTLKGKTMKKLLLLLLATTTCAFCATNANAGDATAVGNAKATIVNNIKITAVEDLDFGVIASTAQANQVTVKAATGIRSATINGSLITDASRPGQRGKFTIAGTPNIDVTIGDIPDFTLTGPEGATMAVKGLKIDAPDGETVTLDDEGQGEFQVGGILHVGASQEVGDYEGAYTVTASY